MALHSKEITRTTVLHQKVVTRTIRRSKETTRHTARSKMEEAMPHSRIMHKVVRMVEVLEGRNDYTDRSGYNRPPDFRSQSQYQGHVNPAGQGQGYNNPQERSNFSQGQAGEHLLLLQHLGLMANHQHLDLMVNLIHLVTMGRYVHQRILVVTEFLV